MTKTATLSPERQSLVQAFDRYLEVQDALAAAEAAYQAARREYGLAQADVSDIEERIDKLVNTRTYGLPQLIGDVSDKVTEARAAQRAAREAAFPLGIAEEQAEARVKAAEYPLAPARMTLADAAAGVIRSESAPFAKACLERLRAALTSVMEVGPDVLVLARERFLAPEVMREAEDVIAFLDRAAGALPGFEARVRNSFWRGAKRVLQDDPAAPLPSAPAP